MLGYLLFLGLLIAILTQWMNELIERIESGTRPVRLADHVLILGWTHRTPYIVLELLRTRGRVTRFLETRDASILRIVVLAEQREEIALGVLTVAGEVHLNPDRGERLAIRDGDQLITLTTIHDPG